MQFNIKIIIDISVFFFLEKLKKKFQKLFVSEYIFNKNY